MTMANEELQLEIVATDGNSTAAKPSIVKIRGVAYSGDEILQWGGERVVVDLAGLGFAEQIPLINSHDNATSSKLGEVTASVEDNKLVIEGSITSQSEEAKRIIEDGKLSKWQLSIGANTLARTRVEAGRKATVNGRTFDGPISVVGKALLREVSVVAIGADKGASMSIEASLCMSELQVTNPITPGGNTMGNNENAVNAAEKTADNAVGRIDASQPVAGKDVNAEMLREAVVTATNEAIKDERQRVAEIQEICAGEFNDIQAKAITGGWSADEVRAEVLKELRAKRPAVGVNVNPGTKSVGRQEIECALCMRLGLGGDELVKDYNAAVVEAACNMSDISLKEVIHEAIKLSGGSAHSRIGISDEDIRAAFSTVSLPGILGNVANKVMLKHFNGVNPVAYRLCSVGSLTDFKPSNRFRLTSLGDLEQVAESGEIKDGSLTEESAVNQIDTYGKKFCLTRKMIIDDDLDAFAKIPAMMGQKAARLVDKLFFKRLLANPVQNDGHALFSAEHKNLSSGAFGKDTLQTAIKMFENQVDADNQPIGATARKLLVPTGLKFAARDLLNSALMIATGTTDALKPSYNSLYEDNIEIVSSPYLEGTTWYLFGNPAEIDTFEIGFLKGKRTPTIQQGDTDFNTLGMWYRIFFDVGVREQDHRGMLKVTGA